MWDEEFIMSEARTLGRTFWFFHTKKTTQNHTLDVGVSSCWKINDLLQKMSLKYEDKISEFRFL